MRAGQGDDFFSSEMTCLIENVTPSLKIYIVRTIITSMTGVNSMKAEKTYYGGLPLHDDCSLYSHIYLGGLRWSLANWQFSSIFHSLFPSWLERNTNPISLEYGSVRGVEAENDTNKSSHSQLKKFTFKIVPSAILDCGRDRHWSFLPVVGPIFSLQECTVRSFSALLGNSPGRWRRKAIVRTVGTSGGTVEGRKEISKGKSFPNRQLPGTRAARWAISSPKSPELAIFWTPWLWTKISGDRPKKWAKFGDKERILAISKENLAMRRFLAKFFFRNDQFLNFFSPFGRLLAIWPIFGRNSFMVSWKSSPRWDSVTMKSVVTVFREAFSIHIFRRLLAKTDSLGDFWRYFAHFSLGDFWR